MDLKSGFKLGLLLWALGSSACYFTTVNPLPKSPAMDPELLGWWKAQPDEKNNPAEHGYFLFMEDKDGYFQVVLMNNLYQYDELYRGFCSEIKGQKYLNVKLIALGNEKQGPIADKNYSLVAYKIVEGKRLDISLLNEEVFRQALAKKRLRGPVPKKGEDLVLSDSTENLALLLANLDPASLLDKPLVPAEKMTELPVAAPASKTETP
jgi:hypothetical protein